MTPHIRNVIPAYRLAHLQQCIYEGAHMKTNRKVTTENPAYKAQKQTFCFVIVLFTVLALMAVFL